jgi:hypothetical protein
MKSFHKVPIKIYAEGKQEKEESVFRYGINLIMKACKSLDYFLNFVILKIDPQKNRPIHQFIKFV